MFLIPYLMIFSSFHLPPTIISWRLESPDIAGYLMYHIFFGMTNFKIQPINHFILKNDSASKWIVRKKGLLWGKRFCKVSFVQCYWNFISGKVQESTWWKNLYYKKSNTATQSLATLFGVILSDKQLDTTSNSLLIPLLRIMWDQGGWWWWDHCQSVFLDEVLGEDLWLR